MEHQKSCIPACTVGARGAIDIMDRNKSSLKFDAEV